MHSTGTGWAPRDLPHSAAAPTWHAAKQTGTDPSTPHHLPKSSTFMIIKTSKRVRKDCSPRVMLDAKGRDGSQGLAS